MAWYSDEQYEMIKDSREKKSIAASAFKQRTHCGKGGSVKLPSDFMSKKELKAMNGEVTSYRLNSPMSWEEFKALPNDLKGDYVKALREKFNVPDSYLAGMFDTSLATLSLYITDLKLGLNPGKDGEWNKEGFLAWRSGGSPGLVKENEPKQETETKYERSCLSWKNFKALSYDKKREYIGWVRETFSAPEKAIAESLGINKATYAHMMSEIDFGVGKKAGGSKRNWDGIEFYAWANMKTEPVAETAPEEPSEAPIPAIDIPVASEKVEEKKPEKPTDELREEFNAAFNKARAAGNIRAVPKFGQMDFECPADLALNTILSILGSSNVRMSIHWDLVEDVDVVQTVKVV